MYSWVIVHHPVHPGALDRVPYNIAMVELREGPRMVTNIVEPLPSQFEAGMELEVVFDDVSEELTLPKFRLTGATAGGDGNR